MWRSNKKRQRGFTIIELMLAMAFLSFVLMFIVMSLVQVMRVYNHGLSSKQVNQSGRSIAAELQRAIQNSNPGEIVISRVNNAQRLCVSGYGFVWNNGTSNANRYSTGAVDDLGFARVPDSNICNNTNPVARNTATELISPSLRPQALTVNATTASSGSPLLYKITFTLSSAGSNNDLVETNPGTGEIKCKTGNPIDMQFCALSTFTVHAMAKKQE